MLKPSKSVIENIPCSYTLNGLTACSKIMTQKPDWAHKWSWTLDFLAQSELLISLISETCWINWLVGEYLHITLYCHYQKHLLPVFYSTLKVYFTAGLKTQGFLRICTFQYYVQAAYAFSIWEASTSCNAQHNNSISAELCGWTENQYLIQIAMHHPEQWPTWLQISLWISAWLLLRMLKSTKARLSENLSFSYS